MRTTSGVIDPVTLGLVALLALGGGSFLANWHPLEMFKAKPPTVELAKLQADLTKAQADAEQARKDKDAAVLAERAKNDLQGKAIQESNALALAAAQTLPEDKKTAETRLTEEMIVRTDFQLAVQLGALPKDTRDGLAASIAKALTGQRAVFDAQIAKKDADFKAVSTERDALRAQIPVLQQKAVKAEETAKASQTAVTGKTNEVAAIADKLDAEKRANGTLGGSLKTAENTVLGVGALVLLFMGVSWYLKHGFSSAGAALHELKSELSEVDYQKVVKTMDANLDTTFQKLVSWGRQKAAAIAATK